MKLRILVIDDDEDLLFIAEQFLHVQEEELELVRATNAQTAIQLIDERNLDAVICDFHLGPNQMNGLEILEWMRDDGIDIPFIIFTGHSREEIAIKALNLGADYYIEKSDDLEGLFTEIGYHIRKVVRSKRTEEALYESEQRYRTLVQSLNDLIFVVDSEDKFVQYHSVSRDELIETPEEFIGKHISKVLPSEIADKYLNLVQEVRASGERQSFDYELMTNGVRRWYTADLDLHEDKESIVVTVTEITKRKQAELDLRNAEMEWRNTFDSIPDLVSVLNSKFEIIKANKSMSDLFGIPPEELIGKKCYELMHRSSEPFPGCPHLDTIKTGLSTSAEINEPCMGKPYLVTTSPIQDDQGEQVGVIHIAKDISERVEGERSIKESESQFRAIFEEAGIGMALVMNGHILEANSSFLKLLGYDENEIKGLTISDITHPDDRGTDQAALQDLVASDKESYKLEKRYIRKDGEIVWGKLTVTLIRGLEGTQDYVIGMVEDVTETKEALRALKESESRHRANFEQAGIGMALVKMDGEVVEANVALQEFLGYDIEELLKMNATYFTHPEDIEKDSIALQNMLEAEETRYQMEKRYIRKDGETVLGRLTVSLIKDADGTPQYTIGMVEDITEHKRTEVLLNEERDRAKTYLNIAGTMILATDTNLDITMINDMGCRILGLAEEEILGKNWIDTFIPEQEQERIRNYMLGIMSGQVEPSKTDEGPVLEISGNIRWIQWSDVVVRETDGQVAGILSAGPDITEKKLAEEELRTSEAKFRAMFEHAAVGVSMVKISGEFMEANKKLEEMLGYDNGQLAGINVFDITIPEDQEVERQLGKELIEGKRDSYNMTKCYVRKDGRKIWGRLTVSIVRDTSGNPEFTIGAIEDITKQSLAEEALRTSEARFRSFFEEARIGMTIVSSDDHIIEVNSAFQELVGYTIDELRNMTIADFTHPDDTLIDAQLFEEMLQGNRSSYQMEKRYIRKDQEMILVHLTVSVVKDERGEITFIVGMVEDITARKEAETALSGSEHKYRTLIDNVQSGIQITQDGIIVFANEILTEMIGYSIEEIVGMPFSNFIAPEDLEWIMARYRKRLAGDEVPSEYDVRLVHRNGSRKQAHLKIANFEFEGKLSTIATITDVTERRNTEDELRESEQRYRLLYENLSDGLFITNLEGIITMCSPQGARLFGGTPDEIIGTHFSASIHPDDKERVAQEFRKGFENRETRPAGHEVKGIRQDRSEIYYHITNTLLIENDQPVGYQSLIRDITEHKQIEAALRESDLKFRQIVESTPMGIHMYELDSDGELIFRNANPAADRLLGVDNSQFIGKTIEQAFSPLADTEIPQRYKEVALKGGTWSTEQIDYEDNKISGAFEVHAYQTMPRKMVATFLDITKRKVTEQVAANNQENFQTVFETIDDLLFIIGLDSKILTTNHAVRELLGYSDEEINGLDASTLHPLDRREEAAEILNTMMEGKTTVCPIPLMAKDGTIIPVETLITLGRWSGEDVLFGVSRDITQRINSEMLLKKTTHDLGERVKEITCLYESTRLLGDPHISFGDAFQRLVELLPSAWQYSEVANARITINGEDYVSSNFKQSKWKQIADIKVFRETIGNIEVNYSEERPKHFEGSFLKEERNLIDALAKHVCEFIERRNSDKALHESEDRYRTLIENIPVVSWTSDSIGNTVFISPNVKEIYGFTDEEIYQRGEELWFSRIHPDDVDNVRQAYTKIFESNDEFNMEYRIKTKDDKWIWLQDWSVRTYEMGGQKLASGVFLDITQRKQVQEELKESEEIIRAVLDQQKQATEILNEERNRAQQYLDIVGSIVLTLDNEGKVTTINRKGCELLGYEADEIIGMSWIDNFIPQRLRADLQEVHSKAMSGKITEVEEYENPVLTKSGEERLLAWRNVALVDDEENIFGAISSAVDITDRARTEERLRAEKEFTETALNSQRDTFFVFDPSTGKAIRWNKVFQEISGYSDDEIKSMKAPDSFYDSEGLEHTSEAIQTVMKEGRANLELTLITKSGKQIPFEYEASLMRVSDNIEYIVSVGRDITERKQALEDIRSSEARYRALFESTNDAIFLIDLDGVHTEVNAQGARMLGYDREELIGNPFLENIAPVDHEDANEKLTKLLAGEIFPVYERTLLKKDGSEISAEINVALVTNSEGQPHHIQSVARDISERKQAEEAIEGQLDFLENVLESLLHPFYVIDANDYTIKQANKVARLGNLEENPTCHYVTHKNEKPCSQSEHPCPLEEVKKTKKPVTVEHQHYDDEGNIRDVEIHAHPIFDNDGNVTQMIEYSLDITEHKKTLRALEESEKRFRILYENAPLGYQTLDENGNVIDINSAWLETTGYTRDEVVGHYFGEFLSEDSERLFEESFPVFKSSGEISDIEYEMIRKDGSQLIGRFSGRTTNDESGKFKQTACIFQDVTGWKVSDDLLRRQKEELSELAHVMSHDLGNKMKNIRTLISLLKREPNEEVLERIDSLAQQTSELLQSSASLAESGLVVEKNETVDLNNLVHEIASTIIPDHIRFEMDPLPRILGDSQRITQIIQNLLSNAVEHGHPSVIEVRKRATRTGVTLLVKNDGENIPEAVKGNIFQRGSTTKGKGRGLGLTIVKKLVEAHGWRIDIESTDMTTFRIIIPHSSIRK